MSMARDDICEKIAFLIVRRTEFSDTADEIVRRFVDPLQDEIERLRGEVELLRALAESRRSVCPYVRSTDEGTAYCSLAERTPPT